ncbi:MAG: magnesium chelatase domain-containing protein, partial [Tunicatimonas sp.]|uniref:magnesium chelatase domain-containing protein n=1 Tax=Tunicatimonas sp. TaxID=1940096 RepID=UPI003C776AA6
MLAKTFGGAVFGVDAYLITIEVSVGQGTKFYMVGLPDSAVKESEQRVEAAIKHSGHAMPRIKTVVNLAPADIRKEGSAYDLPIAVGILAASGQIQDKRLSKYLIMGELSLDGILRPIKGVLPIAVEARKNGFQGFILPKENAREAAIVNNLEVIGVETLAETIDFLQGNQSIEPFWHETRDIFFEEIDQFAVDFSD